MSSQLRHIPATQDTRGLQVERLKTHSPHVYTENSLPDGQSCVAQGFGSATRGHQRQTHIHQTFGELYESSFVRHAQKCCKEREKMNGTYFTDKDKTD